MTRILAILGSFCAWFGPRWEVVKDGWAAIRPTWFAALFTIGASIALQNGQALDALREIARGAWSARLTLFGSVLLLAFAAWYFPRALLYVIYKRVTPQPVSRHERLRKWTPRILGLLPLLAVALAYGQLRSWGHVVFYLIVAGLFLLFMALRFRGRKRPAPGPDLPPVTFRVAVGILALALLCLIAFLNSKVALPQMLGPLGILLLAAAMWISFGSMVLIYPTYRYTVPSGVLLLLLLAGVFSCWNDNHQVRQHTAAEGAAPTGDWRQGFADHLQAWKSLRGLDDGEAQASYPIFLVAAEGGGIRAAYWTASVLAQLEDQVPGFACHLFAVSGVSGGSLGGAVFAALVADLVDQNQLRCDGSRFERTLELTPRVQELLGQDFLAPTLAGMFFPDVMQRFWPIPRQGLLRRFAFPDRATYLEESWEAAWTTSWNEPWGTAKARFEEPFQRLWQDPGAPEGPRRYQVPSLFLNGTWVENGGRVVTSNVKTGGAASFVRLDDMLGCLGRDIRLSTAVHMSARFTYVSPAGTVHVDDASHCPIGAGGTEDDPRSLRVVDGGYFENSGGHTAAEILDELGWPGPVSPLVVSNNTKNPNAADGDDGDDEAGGGDPAKAKRKPFGETLSPVFALLNTRSARGFYAERYLAGRSPDDSIRFQLSARAHQQVPPGTQPEEATFPLGWSLSSATRAEIDSQAASGPGAEAVCRLIYNQQRCARLERRFENECPPASQGQGCPGLEQLLETCRSGCAPAP